MGQRGDLEMSPAEFLADIEVAVTGHNYPSTVVTQRSGEGVEGHDQSTAGAVTGRPPTPGQSGEA